MSSEKLSIEEKKQILEMKIKQVSAAMFGLQSDVKVYEIIDDSDGKNKAVELLKKQQRIVDAYTKILEEITAE